MKIQLDTENHIIKVAQRYANLGELYTLLERFLPNGQWRDYDLEFITDIVWIQPPIEVPNPWLPDPQLPWITICGDPSYNNIVCTTVPGTYNIEIK